MRLIPLPPDRLSEFGTASADPEWGSVEIPAKAGIQ
jgi:hypothetical protein